MKALIWHLGGEYASFRPFYLTSIADTYSFPPKTVVVGMIGAACGWKENDLVDYYERIKVGIKIEHYDCIFNDLLKLWKVEYYKLKPYVLIKRFLYKPQFIIYLTALTEEKLIDIIENRLKDPVYPITLGDSDSLFYPKNRDFLEKIEIDIKPIKHRFFRCLVPKSNDYGGVIYRKEKIENKLFKIYPKTVKMPIRFKKGRKVETIEVLYHSQGEIELEKDLEAYEFKGEPIYLF